MGATGRVAESRNPISIESQLLAISSGFIVLCAVAALFIIVQKQRRRRSSNASRDFHSPLIGFQGKANKFRATSGSFGSSSGGSPAVLSPGSSNSSNSPQCTPLTPYASFSTAVATQNAGPLCATANVMPQLQSSDRGSISVMFNYDRNNGTLQVFVLACHNLLDFTSGTNEQCQLNPYVKIRLLPDNQHRGKTRVLRGTRSPFYDEQFTLYGITPDQLPRLSLHMAVLHFDRYNKDTILGEAFMNLTELDRRDVNDNKQTIELPLYPRPTYNDIRAQVLLSMSFNPQTNSINFAVLKMKDLPYDDQIGLIDAYVKVYLLLNGQRVAKHKTHVKKGTTEPVFNESFSFDLPMTLGGARLRSPEEILEAVSFDLQLLNYGGVTRNELVGNCVIGNESKHLREVIDGKQQVAEWYRIHAL
ncbi:hypothetical protein M3Y98_00524500 [Aphelenchoides besseyi]|nr:hypothetical protein M3Y98_00524500 [Aphelenchoides besseyi]KAI6207980.1 hypothetical protein M3Y96_00066100 [Aphelenchoides besseyi]